MKKHKYGAKPTVVDGIRFASMKEARRYQELKLLEKANKVWGIETQPRFTLTVNHVKVGAYVADFRYYEVTARNASVQIVEDVKGVKTPIYRLKKKMVEAQYGIEIREV